MFERVRHPDHVEGHTWEQVGAQLARHHLMAPPGHAVRRPRVCLETPRLPAELEQPIQKLAVSASNVEHAAGPTHGDWRRFGEHPGRSWNMGPSILSGRR